MNTSKAPQGASTLRDADLPSTSVVVPTYNRASALRELLSPLLADPFPIEVIVVVDGSEDGSMEVLDEIERGDPRLKPVWIQNSGATGAREAGLTQASGEIVLILDDDVRAGPGLAHGHAKWHATHERLLVLGYMPTAVPRKRTSGQFATYLYAEEYEDECKRYEVDSEEILKNLWAGNMSLRRRDAIEVGLSNPKFTARHSDRDFGLRCLKAGLTGVFDRSLHSVHAHYRSLPEFRRDSMAQGEGRARLHELHSDLLGPLPSDEFAKDLPRPLAAIVQTSRRPWAYKVFTAALMAAIKAAERLKLFRLEINLAKLLRRLDQGRGSILADAHNAAA
jgi:glycosyltransferase involved in cell wall biosynthesis